MTFRAAISLIWDYHPLFERVFMMKRKQQNLENSVSACPGFDTKVPTRNCHDR